MNRTPNMPRAEIEARRRQRRFQKLVKNPPKWLESFGAGGFMIGYLREYKSLHGYRSLFVPVTYEPGLAPGSYHPFLHVWVWAEQVFRLSIYSAP